MPLLNGILILLLFQCLGEAIKQHLHLNIPGPVIGMVLLFISLMIHGQSPTSVTKASQTLIPLLGLMFLPASAGIFFLGPALNQQWFAILAAIVVGSVASVFFNALVMNKLSRSDEQ